MLVTFISECEKNSLKKTRRILDAFANRIGNNTWQTPITAEGLDAVKKLLKKTASKNTAVSCHQLKSRIRTELLWVVGNRDKFNNEGIVAVNYTKQDKFIGELEIENIHLIRALAILAALFHDLGKNSKAFQKKLINNAYFDAIRHEWVSIIILSKFINGRDDEEWLEDLSINGMQFHKLSQNDTTTPLKSMPLVGKMIAWLIFTHHLLPTETNENIKDNKWSDVGYSFAETMDEIDEKWGYAKTNQENLADCLKFDEVLTDSGKWQSQVKRWARKLKEVLPEIEKSLQDGSYRLTLNYARTCLMLGDHYFSSLEKDRNYRSAFKDLYANTDKNGLKQYLDEHILGVANQTKKNVDKLLSFENMPSIFDNLALKKSSPDGYNWQDTPIKIIKNWRNKNKLDNNQFGFFAINMASTGKGKTFANAKIIRALSPKADSLRFTLALGLRTLTLQTGDEYRNKIKLKDDELAVLIGSKAISDLHHKDEANNEKEEGITGSESQQSIFNDEVVFNGDLSKGLDTVLKSKKSKQMLYAPVLSCTIDHIIGVSETKRGGKYILPFLRLMSSDLVIDEVDDFDGKDLIAIGRLIHAAGMLGRKVMISSATIPPDLAEGFFNAYQSGWQIFAKMRGKNLNIGCLWVDEFNAITNTAQDYKQQHDKFIKKRVERLNKEKPKRKVNIVKCSANIDEYFEAIKNEIIVKHNDNYFEDEKGNKVSIGVVRVANIKPCVKFAKYLLTCDFPENTEIRTMAYHSQQVLIMRHEQEKYLDSILKNRNKVEKILTEKIVKNSTNKNIIFVLVATPVEEVGRDHDFDWAIIEPSSYRSFIQLAGRVLRHRNKIITKPNVAIMQYNYKTLKTFKEGGESKLKKTRVFINPGYQKQASDLDKYNLNDLIDTKQLANKLDATNRIQKSKNPHPTEDLADLEHKIIADLLLDETIGASTLKGWFESNWWLSALPQTYAKFRESSGEITLFLTLDKGFVEKDKWGGGYEPKNRAYGIEVDKFDNFSRLWISRNYEESLKRAMSDFNKADLIKTALTFGEINITTYGSDLNGVIYNEQLGFIRK
ncbi:CRISPR-associated helicase Cas3, Yersinia-type [Bathymodiolus thermophilus thioautotrophic gill symbiont]|uniref:type I-F CRISPR-associated helicase Cas3f n=1 Tax=Bathymodiolus thermophilus thioautotrophic gill symbiont TaxID=2360 RepID=UPI0010B86D9F|nr:type I-F CRISPR-associated helicase Cas3f [Bathymodiolus thermophilus thioautotrophic gill symbiont]SGZ81109.1 CRISPR-associated helicase Cas3, Yersinia-type [Bathymodiolus thermophilus thioautotrophic gill symbiont]